MNDFPRAVEIAARVVGAHGTVLPATSEVVTLVAEFEDGRVLSGETTIAAAGGRIARGLADPGAPALPARDVRGDPPRRRHRRRARAASIRASSRRCSCRRSPTRSATSGAVRVLVANLMTEPGETDDYSVLEHVLTIERHLDAQLFDCVIYNTAAVPEHLAAAYAARRAVPIVTGSVRAERARAAGRRADRGAARVGAPRRGRFVTIRNGSARQ